MLQMISHGLQETIKLKSGRHEGRNKDNEYIVSRDLSKDILQRAGNSFNILLWIKNNTKRIVSVLDHLAILRLYTLKWTKGKA